MPVIGRIRGACERIVEEHLFNRVIQRHESKINVGCMESVAVVTVEQYKKVHMIWRECSNIIEAHAKPRSGPIRVPPPDVLKSGVNDLSECIEDVQTVRNSNAKAPVAPAQVIVSETAKGKDASTVPPKG